MQPKTYERITTYAGLAAMLAQGVAYSGVGGKYGWVAGLVGALATGAMGWAANKGVQPKF